MVKTRSHSAAIQEESATQQQQQPSLPPPPPASMDPRIVIPTWVSSSVDSWRSERLGSDGAQR